MSRPLRLEFSGALYHVTARGNERKAIYREESDFEDWLELLAQVCSRHNWIVHAYCLMTNHYHLLVETPDGNLSKGMRQLNGVFTQKFNRKHRRVGHLFQGRYKAILVDKEAYLLELNRYIVLNPVRANMVDSVGEWQWSSYLDTTGRRSSAEWLASDAMLRLFGRQRQKAIAAYEQFVCNGLSKTPWQQLKHQIFLGSDDFVKKHQQLLKNMDGDLSEIPAIQKRAKAKPLAEYVSMDIPRNMAMTKAYYSGFYTMAEIGKAFGVHYATVSRAIKKDES